MKTVFFSEVRQSLIPARSGNDGPLPPMLIAMTLVTGLVDAFSYLVLGHVFVANMTGNVVLLGFALVGARGFSITASLAAIATFAVGAVIGGQLGSRFGKHRGHLLRNATLVQGISLAGAVVLGAITSNTPPAGYRYGLIILLAVAMGVQNATARKLAVPDLTTTVLTLTITGIAADSTILGGTGSKAGRRTLAVAAMLLGAVIGATLVIHGHIAYPLVIALALIVCVGLAAHSLSGSRDPWALRES
ncbi:MAG: YoaK family protein [Acidimicrobiales bacterium]